MSDLIMAYRVAIGSFYNARYCRLSRGHNLNFKFWSESALNDFLLNFKNYFVNLFMIWTFIASKNLLRNNDFQFLLLLLILLSMDVHENPGPLSELSIFNWNARSLRNKINDLCDISNEFNILCITESHLDQNVSTNEILIENFSEPFRRDRNFAGGGIVLYISEDLYAKRRPDLESDYFEAIWVELVLKSKTFTIGVMYRPPNSSNQFWGYLNYSVDKAFETTNNVIVTGDLNTNLLLNLNNHPLHEIMHRFSLINTITEPTRIGNANTLLDPILISDTITCNSASVIDVDRTLSDHNACVSHIQIPDKIVNTYQREVWIYKRGDYDLFNNLLNTHDWGNLFNSCDNVNEACELFTNQFLDIAKQCIPTKKITIRPNDKPWMNSDLRREIKFREKLHKRYVRNKTPENLENFKRQRNKVNNMKKFARTSFYENVNGLIDQHYSNDPKSYWKLLNHLIKKSGTSSSIPPLIDNANGSIVNDDLDKANLLNTYFSSISTLNDSNTEVPAFDSRTDSVFDSLVISQNDVVDVLKNLKIGKASGCDRISHQMLKYTAESVCKPLTTLFNMSLQSNEFPSLWKKATVIPLHKKDSKHEVSNYRPVSLISCVGKVLERVVFKYMFNFLIENDLFYKQQSGFLPKHNTVYQLIEMYDNICNSLEEKKHTCIVFCDISKAFDRVWHRGLIKKLDNYGFKGNFMNWLKSYISNRQQQVIVRSEKSTYLNINAGVPQGSVLGPLLFLLYINDIADNLESLARLFADDTSISHSSTDIRVIEQFINSDLRKLKEWSQKWLTIFNPNKTEVLFISNILRDANLSIFFDNTQLIPVESHRHLGVVISADAKWTDHINSIHNSCMKKINCLRKLKYVLCKFTLLKIYKCFILPVLEYASELWDGCTVQDREKLESVQLEAARIACGLPIFCSREAIYLESGLQTLDKRREIRKLSLFYKMHNHIVPPVFQSLLPPKISDITNYPLRNTENYILPHYRLSHTEKSFIPSTVRLWNELDIDIRNTPTLQSFKTQITPQYNRHACFSIDHRGKRQTAILFNRLRHHCSILKYDLYRCNLVENSTCECGNLCENSYHFFFDCPIYVVQRNKMYQDLSMLNYIDLDILMYGSEDLSPDSNKHIFDVVYRYIQATERF